MRTYLAGLRKIFADSRNDESVPNLAALKAHYANSHEGIDTRPRRPQNTVNQFGPAMFRAKKIDEAIDEFEENTKLYPDSSYVFVR